MDEGLVEALRVQRSRTSRTRTLLCLGSHSIKFNLAPASSFIAVTPAINSTSSDGLAAFTASFRMNLHNIPCTTLHPNYRAGERVVRVERRPHGQPHSELALAILAIQMVSPGLCPMSRRFRSLYSFISVAAALQVNHGSARVARQPTGDRAGHCERPGCQLRSVACRHGLRRGPGEPARRSRFSLAGRAQLWAEGQEDCAGSERS